MLAAKQGRTRARRDPGKTREALLEAAFDNMYRSGFQGTDLDSILETAGVTKGALYHHFQNKEALGYAVVDEVIGQITQERWAQPLEGAEDPIGRLIAIVQSTSLLQEHVERGCPLNNLAQEMSPLDEGFRTRIAAQFNAWRGAIATALRSGQERGLVRGGVDTLEAATFLVATYEGYISLAKNAQDFRVLQSGKKIMVRYLETLRAPA
ncbi:TetR/AcrR family transcriptional regulator [uncultured Paludibaculum sp.]|uniref:TetR/AcrR family transcriptional regulator n=1 Tax=uncultured Paludibaculum sp. TaxID=1765020 RepID=UPI002AABB73C|nr:TetR/AcrR family transcriptional regulator [uncultured Paludibaculum sp.]